MTATNSVFQLDTGKGWTRGLPNMLSAELRAWFRTRRWWSQILIWAAVVNLAVGATATAINEPATLVLVVTFSSLLGVAAPIGVAILMQGALVGEKRSGTGAWVLSKPVSRRAFVVAKLVASILGVTVTIVLAQGLIAYLIIWTTQGTALPPLQYLGGLGVELLSLVFYIALGLMLGALFAHPGPVVAIPLAFLFGQQMVLNLMPKLAPTLVKVLPWLLTMPNGNGSSIALAVMLGEHLPTYLPIVTTLVASVLFVAIALWAFEREEL